MTFVTANVCGGLVYGMNASFFTTYSEFYICTDGSYHLDEINVLTTSLLHGFTTLNTGVGQTNVIAVVANGPTIDLYINGQKTNSITFKTTNAGGGTLGLVVYGQTDKGPAEAAFKNAKVWTF
jgi:hypothetical protein